MDVRDWGDPQPYFSSREDAGQRLAPLLRHLDAVGVVVLGVPRGGVPVARAVADEIGAPLDVIIIRKLGVPGQPELAMGAIGEGGVRVLHRDVIAALGITTKQIERIERGERTELDRRVRAYRGGRPMIEVADKVVVVVDDGIATGATIEAACEVIAAHGATRIVVAAPVVARPAVGVLERMADEVICVGAPRNFQAIGQFYGDFSATSDDEVRRILSLG